MNQGMRLVDVMAMASRSSFRRLLATGTPVSDESNLVFNGRGFLPKVRFIL
jgi:hypothetical protein